MGDPTQLTIIIVTTISTLVTALVTLTAQKRAHKNEREARARTDAQHLAAAIERFEALTNQIALNTTLTRETSMRADDAYKEANEVNHKIAMLGGMIQDNSAAIGAGSTSAAAAYHEANSVNMKIAMLTKQVAELYATLKPKSERDGDEERRSSPERRKE